MIFGYQPFLSSFQAYFKDTKESNMLLLLISCSAVGCQTFYSFIRYVSPNSSFSIPSLLVLRRNMSEHQGRWRPTCEMEISPIMFGDRTDCYMSCKVSLQVAGLSEFPSTKWKDSNLHWPHGSAIPRLFGPGSCVFSHMAWTGVSLSLSRPVPERSRGEIPLILDSFAKCKWHILETEKSSALKS